MSIPQKSSLKRTFEASEAETEDTSSLQEYIDSEKKINEIAGAVLGGSDPANCSYSKNYVFRQALYCCLTCLNEKKSELTKEELQANDYLHGICLACSYECHSDHELVELYTKRDFRCDCGNSKFPNSRKCKFFKEKDPVNELNKYNHNFVGNYCTCNRPYPETEEDNEGTESNSEEMSQCTICEDWFHTNHLNGSENLPENQEYEELICQECMKNNQFLWNYQGYIATKSISKVNRAETEVEVEALNVSGIEPETTEANKCFIKNQRLKEKNENYENQACYFLNGWREALCKCIECLELYKSNKIEFITDIKDSITFYEELGKEKQPSEEEETKLMNDQLSKLNRVSRVEFLHNVNDFKSELTDFLQSFASKGEVVKTENINEFFENLEKRKKMRLENNAANYYCQ